VQMLSNEFLPDFLTYFGGGTGVLASGTSATVSLPFYGAQVGDAVVVNTGTTTLPDGMVTTAWATSNSVNVRFANPTAGNLTVAANTIRLYVTVIPQVVDLPTTAQNLAASLNYDALASQSVRAVANGSNQLLLQSSVAGAEGNRNHVQVSNRVLGIGITSVANVAGPATLITTTGSLALLAPHLNVSPGFTNNVFLTGFAGLNPAAVNNKVWKMTVFNDTQFTIAFDNTGGDIAVPAGSALVIMRPVVSNEVTPTWNNTMGMSAVEAIERMFLTAPTNNDWLTPSFLGTESNFVGGVDVPVNAGNGISNVSLTGMTERLPLGILLSDCDFMSENPLNDSASAVQTFPSALRPIQKLLPLSSGGREYERFLGAAGDLVAQADGSILQYTAYNAITAPAGTRAYRMYRGGGSLYVLDGITPGGPVDWATTSFPPAIRPVLKGGVLVGKAMLVRNFPETAFAAPRTTSYGDEIQMLVATYGVFGSTQTTVQGITLDGNIGSAGYGEGYGASDRYRIDGKPMFRDTTFRHVDPATVQPTPYIKGS